ncbi:ABC transporter ATP-binding protein [Rhodothermus profundi]|uniref:ABC-2 type transport system ATP-binding protein n=1 Tax=Rhodothermus profundi TaxID=633813 RepID=A0A1M6X9Z5_9BACT|nr:ABC transporter ATP-binding protein [Rhodothermus profundi]SHL02810.1 ABC-2 type transport system ATP-binding protein [Rhodothermus profundi]
MEIRLIRLKKRYGETMAVDIPELTIRSGELVGVVGRNGAGKTTLLRLILDLVAPTEGQVLLDGQDVRQTAAWKQQTSAYLDDSFLIPFLTPDEYLTLVGQVYGLDENTYRARLEALASFLDPALLATRTYVRDLSAGNRQRVGLAAALLVQPRLLVLDEPFAHLDPTACQQLTRLLQLHQQQRHATILFTSHHLNEVVGLAQRILVMQDGRIVRDVTEGASAQQELEAYFAGLSKAS